VSDVSIRPLVAADAAGIARAVEAGRAHDEFKGSSDAEGTFVLKVFEMDPSIFGGAFASDGALIGLVSSEIKITLVAPPWRRQGIGRRLVDLAEAMERERGRPDVFMGIEPGNEAGRAFLLATGFAFHSTLWDLALPPGAVVAPLRWPAGTVVRPFDRSRDIEPWVALFNAAFADHATPLQLDAGLVADSVDDPAIADADTLLVEDTSGALIGFCATSPIRVDGRIEPHAEIWTIGVRPDQQGRGLGRQLLRWGVAYLRSLGVEDVALSVNGRNERALRLYEDEGFARTRTRERWARPVRMAASVRPGRA